MLKANKASGSGVQSYLMGGTVKVDPHKAADVRAGNRSTVLRELLKNRPTTRKQIAFDSGLSAATVSRAVEDLIHEGIVDEGAELSSRNRGRRAIQIDVVKDLCFVAGIDIGASKTRISIANFVGEPVAVTTTETQHFDAPRAFATWLLEQIAKVAGSRWQNISTIGIGVPGSVREDQQAITNAPNLEIVEQPQFLAELRKDSGRLVTVDNDVNLALLGEQCFGAARDTPNSALVNIGAGLGTALSVNNAILHGPTGLVGEYGNMPFADSRLENYLTGPGLSRLLAQAGFSDTRPETLFTRVGSDLAPIRELVDKAFVTLLTAVSVSIEPTVLILGGGVIESLSPSLSRYEDLLRTYVHQAPNVVPAQLGELSGAIGAHVAALHTVYESYGIPQSALIGIPQISDDDFLNALEAANVSPSEASDSEAPF